MAIALLLFASPARASAPIGTLPPPTTQQLKDYARKEAIEAKLNPEQVIRVITCETAGTWNPEIQSGHKNVRDGGRELSFGLAQIHLPAHPDVSLEEATDPYFAIDWLIEKWKKGKQRIWSCYNLYY